MYKPKSPPPRHRGLVFGLKANLIVTAVNMLLLFAANGARLRPMGQATVMFLAAVFALMFGMARCADDAVTGARLGVVMIGVVLNLLPLPLGLLELEAIRYLKGLVYSP
ncbi:MAG: hypothetical protein ACHRXM_02995 [Isosphaerales bacterium]